MHAPSPITKPARVASNGRDARVRVLLLGDEPAHRAEAGEDEGDDRRLGAAGEHDVRLAAADRRRCLADRGRARRARGDRREVLPLEAELDRDLPARRVDEHGRDEERRDAVGAALGEDLLLLRDRRDAADRRPDEDPDARCVDVLESRVVPRLLRGGDGEQDVAVHPPRLLRRDEVAGVEAAHLGRDPHGVLGGVERLDPPDAAPARHGRVPRRRGVEPERRDRPETGDHDAPHDARRLLGGTVCPMARPRRSRTSEPVERPADLDAAIPFPPMEAELVRELPDGDEWQYEPKWDGFRGLLENASGELRLWSRNARPLLRYFPELAPLGELLPPRSCLDGEIVIVRDGVLDFDAMQTRLHPAESRVRKLSAEIPATFVAFDVLVWDGEEHWPAPLAERRTTLEKVASAVAPLALHARPRRGARVALVVRGDRARRRDREAARRAVPRGRARPRSSR